MTYREWCRARSVTHAHCPCDCDHPQPFVTAAGSLLCGACWVEGLQCTMKPCTPDICPDEALPWEPRRPIRA